MAPRILLLGGHGRVSLYMTPAFLSRSWHVTSVIRNPSHAADIESAGAGQPGKLDVLVSSLDNVTSEQHAQSILDKTKPDWVVWSAGIPTLPLSLISTYLFSVVDAVVFQAPAAKAAPLAPQPSTATRQSTSSQPQRARPA